MLKNFIIFLFAAMPFLAVAQQAQVDTIQVFSKLNYYTTEPEATVVALLPEKMNAGKGFTLNIYQGNKQMSHGNKHIDNRLESNVPLKDTGTYQYTYIIKDNQNVLAKGVINLTKLVPTANEVKINQLTGGLTVDGAPFVPFGFYCGPVGKLPDQEVLHGFNMIGPYQDNFPEGLPARRAYMDRCAAIGIRVQYGVNSLVGFGHNGDKGLDKTENEKLELLRQEVLAFRNHPALLSWYINDEPDGQGRPPEVLEKAYKLIHDLDPYHPVSIVFMMPSKIGQFKNTMDIAMTDPYPIPGQVDKVGDDVNFLRRTLDYRHAVWLVPQAFGGSEMWQREPTAKEIRVMTYLGLLNGATGIQYYVHAPSNQDPQSVSAWSACSDIAVETAQMTPFLLSEQRAPLVKVNSGQLVAKSYWFKNYLLIVVANKENKPVSFTVQFEQPKVKMQPAAQLWFENREVPVTDNSLSDMIDAYSTRVYLIAPEAADEKLNIPGNLTFNPDFEKVYSPGLAAGSNMNLDGNKKADLSSTFFVDTHQQLQGLFSLRLITPSDSGGATIRLTPFVVNAGNSYSVSVWAKAKADKKLHYFDMDVKELAMHKSFMLDTCWKRYSFTIQPKASSTNTILSFRLVNKGTAWFDMLQVNPDPVISYSITPENTAKVMLVTHTANAELKYLLSTEGTTTKPKVYKKELIIRSPQTVTAQLFVNHIKIGETHQFIPINKALGKPVKLITPVAPQYPAQGGKSLTDGKMASTSFKDPNWLGFTGNEVLLQVDLQQVTALNKVSLNLLCDANSGIFLPKKIEILTSNDGVNFTPAGKIDNPQGSVRGEPYTKAFTLKLANMAARYVQFKALSIGKIPDKGYLFPGTNPWIFTDEILVE